MPYALGSGTSSVAVGTKYDPDSGGPATLGPNLLIRRIQFVVANAPVFVQTSYNGQVWDRSELPYGIGTWTIDGIQGIRFRNASAAAAVVTAVAYLEGDPLPLAANQAASRGGVTYTQFVNAGANQVYTPPAGVRGLIFELWSGGGGSGGIVATAAGQAAASGGGGSGGYACLAIPYPYIITSLGVGSSLTQILISIGAGGIAGAAGANNGQSGGTSNLNFIFSDLSNINVASIFGGSGGQGSGAVTDGEVTAGKGAGGILNALQGQAYSFDGNPGNDGITYTPAGAGARAAGGNAPRGGHGGVGGRGAGTGQVGQSPGGGAAGAYGNNGNAAFAGAAGSVGGCIVTELYA